MAGHLTLALIKPHVHLERKAGQVMAEWKKRGLELS